MVRKIIHIDQEKCNGCGACANACHENAIVMENGKAKLLKDDFCDGLGDCLPSCPTGAITIEERESAEYNPAAVEKRKQMLTSNQNANTSHGARGHHCPGSATKTFSPKENENAQNAVISNVEVPSQLRQWPVQIKLISVQAPFYENANLLIAADCCAYAYAAFHKDFMKGKITLIGCPKLDAIDYTEKLTEIITNNNIKSVTVARMEVPCCGGLENAVVNALKQSGKFLQWRVVTISRDGKVLED